MAGSPQLGMVVLFPKEADGKAIGKPGNYEACEGQKLYFSNAGNLIVIGHTYGGGGQVMYLPNLPLITSKNYSGYPSSGTYRLRYLIDREMDNKVPENIGMITLLLGTDLPPPEGWMFCDGALLRIEEHADTYSVIGNTYGGDGTTTFALPNLPPVKNLNGQGTARYIMCVHGFLPSIGDDMVWPLVGTITLFAGKEPPVNWAFCDGQTLTRAKGAPLMSAYHVYNTNTTLPDLLPVKNSEDQGQLRYIICLNGDLPSY